MLPFKVVTATIAGEFGIHCGGSFKYQGEALRSGASWVIVIKAEQFRLVRTVVLRPYLGLKSPGQLGQAQITAQTTRVADLLGRGWNRICNRFPDRTGTAASGEGPTWRTTGLKVQLVSIKEQK